jgi:hypothetical protein
VADVPEGFPSRLSDDELAEAIEQWSVEYRTRYPNSKLPELILAFINSALQEQSNQSRRLRG